MIFLMTKDSFLLHGLMNLKDDRKVIKINNLYDINNISDMPFKVVIDTYHNHILDEESMEFLPCSLQPVATSAVLVPRPGAHAG